MSQNMFLYFIIQTSFFVLCKGDSVCKDLTKHKNFHLLPDPDNCGQGGSSVGARIHGGRNAALREFPWMVYLKAVDSYYLWPFKRLNSSFCGGSLITDRMVLTAAHCISGRDNSVWYITKMKAYIGDWDLSNLDEEDPSERYDCTSTDCGRITFETDVDKIITHENYTINPNTSHLDQKFSYDIALVRLKDPITTFNRQFQPICLPWNCALRHKRFNGVHMSVAGWGVDENGNYPKILKTFENFLQPESYCADVFQSFAFEVSSYYCGKLNNTNTTISKGDAGGPLMYNTNLLHPRGEHRLVLMGVLTAAVTCNYSSNPSSGELEKAGTSIITDAAYYMEWILDHLEGSNEKPHKEDYLSFGCLDLSRHKNFNLLPKINHCGQTELLWKQFPEEFNNTLALQVEARIRGGSPTKLREFPWIAYISIKIELHDENYTEEYSSCGGSLINENYVLSAAHCFRPAPPNHKIVNHFAIDAQVYLGEYAKLKPGDDPDQVDCMPNEKGIIKCNPPVARRYAAKFILHPFYDARTKINDIALLRLNLPHVRYNAFIMPVCLPWSCSLKGSSWKDYNVALAGWGSGEALEKDDSPELLKKYNATIMDKTECEKLWGEPKLESQMCLRRESAAACPGDAGGPAVMLSPQAGPTWNHRFVQMGIYSFGPACVTPTDEADKPRWTVLPDVLTNVSFHMKWILDTIVP